MSDNRLYVAATLVALLIVTAGCLGTFIGSSEGELTGDYSEDEFDEFIDDAMAASESVDSYSVEMTMDMSGDAGSVSMDASGNADLAAEEMKMELSMSGSQLMPGAPSDFTMYVDGELAYVEMDGEWETMPAEQGGDEIWNTEDDVLVQDAQYTYGDVHVDDQGDVIEVTTELDGSAMDDFLDETGEYDPGMSDAQAVDWSDVEIVERFDAETTQLTESVMTAEIEEQGERFDYEYEIQFDDFDDDLDTTVPEEVRQDAN